MCRQRLISRRSRCIRYLVLLDPGSCIITARYNLYTKSQNGRGLLFCKKADRAMSKVGTLELELRLKDFLQNAHDLPMEVF